MTSKKYIVPWIFVAISSVIATFEIGQVQTEISRQQVELEIHQRQLERQLVVNEQLRVERAKLISDFTTKQCVTSYRVESKLVKLALDQFDHTPIDDPRKASWSAFAAEVARNQGDTQCQNPVSQSLLKIPQLRNRKT